MACYYIENGSLESSDFERFETLIKSGKYDPKEIDQLYNRLGIIEGKDFDTLKQNVIADAMSDWSKLNFFNSGFNA
jgi:hypothetical protein